MYDIQRQVVFIIYEYNSIEERGGNTTAKAILKNSSVYGNTEWSLISLKTKTTTP